MADYIHIDETTVKKDYFDWLKSIVGAEDEYSFLWWKLHNTDFIWLIDRDENRAEDGKYLRYIFTVSAYDRVDFNPEEVDEYLSGPCSVMELLVGLARRMEHDIMENDDLGDRTGVWFHEMIANLGLDKYDDKHYSETKVSDIIHRFMGRKYGKTGVGNVFKVGQGVGHNFGPDLRNLEIWDQLQVYVLEKYPI